MDSEGIFRDTYEDVPEKLRRKVPSTCFPPSNASTLGLEKWCVVLVQTEIFVIKYFHQCSNSSFPSELGWFLCSGI